MSDLQSNFITEIGQTLQAINPRNYRHRQEIQAKRFEQVIYFDDEEEGKNNKEDIHKSKKNESLLTDSDSEDDSCSSSSECSEKCDDSFSESSCLSDSDSEEYNIWDNSDFDTHGLDIDNLKFCKNEEQTFFTLYKLRYSQVRNFLTKKLTQNQHQQINVNILKIVKSLSQNKIQQIQCHNYNYFQSLADNQQYQRFAQHVKQFNNPRRCNQIQQKQEHINSIQKCKTIQLSTPKIYQGIKVAMNRASFSSSKEGSPSEYYLTCRDKINSLSNQQGSTSKNLYEQSLLTQDTINSQSKRTIKDFDIDSDLKAKESQMQAVNQFNSQRVYNSKITSLTHIPDESQKSVSIIQNNISQKKFNLKNIQITKSYFRKSTANIASIPQINILLKEQSNSSNPSPITIESSPTDNSAQTNDSQQHTSYKQSTNQMKVNGILNQISYQTQPIDQMGRNKYITEQISPITSIHNIDNSPRNKTKARNLPYSQSTIPQRETNQIYFNMQSPSLTKINNKKPSTSLSQIRPFANLHNQQKPVSQQQRDERFLPNLKSEKLITHNDQQGIQQRSTSNHLNSFYNSNYNDNTLASNPSSMINKHQNSPASNNFSKKLSFLEKQHYIQDNQNCSGKTEQNQKEKSDHNTPNRVSINKGYNSPSLNKLRNQKLAFGSNQSYHTLLNKQIGDSHLGDLSQRSSQEYLLHSKMACVQKNHDQQHQVAAIAGCQNQQQNNQNATQPFSKLQFQNTFFKNQYISSTSTNHGLIQSFKHITQN